jgi:hypothetical protein
LLRGLGWALLAGLADFAPAPALSAAGAATPLKLRDSTSDHSGERGSVEGPFDPGGERGAPLHGEP